MRYFNTTGPCNPAEHYTVLREKLMEKGRRKVERGRYFTIFAPRQSGKTTYFQLLIQELKKEPYTPIWVSFEHLKTATREEFYLDFSRQLKRRIKEFGVFLDLPVNSQVSLGIFFEELEPLIDPLVLIIDEFEGIPDIVMGELMHAFRKLYHQKGDHCLRAMILVGVSTLAELVVSHASPFNVADELTLPYFTFEEIEDLIGQYEAESGQPFAADVIEAIHENTKGQPGLVCGICEHLTDAVATDRSKPVQMDDFYKTLKHYLTRKFDKNIINIVQKARTKKPFMFRLLFMEEPVPFTVDDPDIAYLYANGVVENVDDNVAIPVPIYAKRLITAFQPLFNDEHQHYVSAHDTFSEYVSQGVLNIRAILKRYREYVRRRGFRAFDTENLKEAAWHYSLDSFINFFIERLGGQTLIEVPSGRGRTDILILHKDQKHVIETKIYTDRHYFDRGKRQLAAYLASEGLEEGFYVVFSRKHTEADEIHTEEIIDGKRIITDIIPTVFGRPSNGGYPIDAS